jgi:hypothetical protein
MVLGKVVGPKTEVTRDWRRLPKEVLHDVYSLPYNLHVIKPRIMRWGIGYVACWERGEIHTGVWWVNLRH